MSYLVDGFSVALLLTLQSYVAGLVVSSLQGGLLVLSQ
jgi:hypothetical protein